MSAKGDGSFFSWFFNVRCLFRNLNLFFNVNAIVYILFYFVLFFLKFRGLLICVCTPFCILSC